MLQTNDVGVLFEKMLSAYGNRWSQPTDAMPDWQKALRRYSPQDVMDAAERAITAYPDFPPTLGQFLGLLRDSGSTGSNQELVIADRVYAYTRPQTNAHQQGNPLKISLPESVARRQPGENVEDYRRRIVDAITFAKYPKLGSDGRSIGDYT